MQHTLHFTSHWQRSLPIESIWCGVFSGSRLWSKGALVVPPLHLGSLEFGPHSLLWIHTYCLGMELNWPFSYQQLIIIRGLATNRPKNCCTLFSINFPMQLLRKAENWNWHCWEFLAWFLSYKCALVAHSAHGFPDRLASQLCKPVYVASS